MVAKVSYVSVSDVTRSFVCTWAFVCTGFWKLWLHPNLISRQVEDTTEKCCHRGLARPIKHELTGGVRHDLTFTPTRKTLSLPIRSLMDLCFSGEDDAIYFRLVMSKNATHQQVTSRPDWTRKTGSQSYSEFLTNDLSMVLSRFYLLSRDVFTDSFKIYLWQGGQRDVEEINWISVKRTKP